MSTRGAWEYFRRTYERYRKATKAKRSELLDEFCEVLGYNRKHSTRLLNGPRPERRPTRRKRRPRGPQYTQRTISVLAAIWEASGYPWSVRLKALLPIWPPWARKRFRISGATQRQLEEISARQMDRRLAPYKRRVRRRIYGRTKPGSLLKHQIPVKTDHWDVKEPGSAEFDLVSHSGNSAAGEFIYSLNLTDIHTTWVETRAVLGKGQTRVHAALEDVSRSRRTLARQSCLGARRWEHSRLYLSAVVPCLNFVRRHRGRRTVHQLENGLGRFCAWLDTREFADLGQLTASLLRDFISSLVGRFKRSTVAVHASALRGFLAYLRLEGVLDKDLGSSIELPPRYSMAQPPQVLSDESVECLLAAIDRSSPLGKRDLAMLLLATRYGLRSADIRGLRFDHVHWREQRIVLVQSKIQRRLELPLLAEVDHALVSYIREGRPSCPAREIFVRHMAPIGPLARRNGLWSVMRRVLSATGVEIPAGERGSRLLLLLTGLRRGELLTLQDENVDLSEAVLAVRHGKFGKSRLVPSPN